MGKVLGKRHAVCPHAWAGHEKIMWILKENTLSPALSSGPSTNDYQPLGHFVLISLPAKFWGLPGLIPVIFEKLPNFGRFQQNFFFLKIRQKLNNLVAKA